MAGLPCENNVELRYGLVLRAGIVHRFRVRLVSKVLIMISGSFTYAPIPPVSLPKLRFRCSADCGLGAGPQGGRPWRLSCPRRHRLIASPRMRVASCGAWKPIEFSDITKSIM